MKDGERRQLARASRHAGDPQTLPQPRECALVLCDGGSRGNPGPAAAAAVLLSADGAVLASQAALIGRATAAEAEYRAILLGLQLAQRHGADPVEVRSDSQLAIAAFTGDAPSAPAHAQLVQEIDAAASAFTAVRWCWHARRANEPPDALVRRLLWSDPVSPAARTWP